MRIRPAKTMDLEHRADFVRGAMGDSLVVVAAEDGQVSVCDPDAGGTAPSRAWTFAGLTGPDPDATRRMQVLFGQVGADIPEAVLAAFSRSEASEQLRAVSVHPTADMLAWIGGPDGRLEVVDLDGRPVARLDPPPLHPGSSPPRPSGFWACQFDAAGEFLWCVAPVADREFVVQTRSIRDWSITAAAVAPKYAGECHCEFEGVGPPGSAALTFSFGQEGSDLLWLRRVGTEVEVTQETRLSEPGPVVFSPDNSECLVYAVNLCELHRFEYPSLRPAGRCNDLIQGVSLGATVCYLDQNRALILGYPWRVILFDVRAMRAVDEVVVEGHDLRPLREWNPALGGSKKELWSDIRWVTRVGSTVVLVYDPERGAGGRGRRDSLLCIPLNDFAG